MSRQSKIDAFDPSGFSLSESGIFGLPFDRDDAQLVIIPVPWDVTVSYSDGTAGAPEAILEASKQVDLFYSGIPDAWKMGVAMEDVPLEWADLNRHYRKKAQQIIDLLADGNDAQSSDLQARLAEVNEQCADLCEYVRNTALALMAEGKKVALVGGDHSTPLGLMQAMAQHYPEFGVLQLDAHADLRDAFEGFEYSHASISFNALKIKELKTLVQVGVRDMCEAEVNLINGSNGRVVVHYDAQMKQARFGGELWNTRCAAIISDLPQNVYITVDIDGLDPKLCPNTGTPVPGGLEFEEAVHLIRKVVDSGRTIIGFDLVEVGPSENEWDANVGARLLYHLCNQMGRSNGLLQ